MKRINKIKRPKGGMNIKVSNKKAVNKRLAEVYQANKALIKEKMALPEGDTRKIANVFKGYVKARMEYQDMTLNEALNQLERSRIFTSSSENYKQNLMTAINKEPDLREDFRKMRGWNTAFNYDKLVYQQHQNKETIYYYDNKVGIAVSDSPEGEGGSRIRLWMI